MQSRKGTTPPSDSQAKEKLIWYVYEYLLINGAQKAAAQFLQEIRYEKHIPVSEAPGFLAQWWGVFYDVFSAAPERRETYEHSSEAKAFHDYGFVNSVVPNGLPNQNGPLNPGAMELNRPGMLPARLMNPGGAVGPRLPPGLPPFALPPRGGGGIAPPLNMNSSPKHCPQNAPSSSIHSSQGGGGGGGQICQIPSPGSNSSQNPIPANRKNSNNCIQQQSQMPFSMMGPGSQQQLIQNQILSQQASLNRPNSNNSNSAINFDRRSNNNTNINSQQGIGVTNNNDYISNGPNTPMTNMLIQSPQNPSENQCNNMEVNMNNGMGGNRPNFMLQPGNIPPEELMMIKNNILLDQQKFQQMLLNGNNPNLMPPNSCPDGGPSISGGGGPPLNMLNNSGPPLMMLNSPPMFINGPPPHMLGHPHPMMMLPPHHPAFSSGGGGPHLNLPPGMAIPPHMVNMPLHHGHINMDQDNLAIMRLKERMQEDFEPSGGGGGGGGGGVGSVNEFINFSQQ